MEQGKRRGLCEFTVREVGEARPRRTAPLGGASRVPVPNAKSGIRMAMRAVSRGASRDAFKTEGYLQNHIKHAHQRRAP